MFKHQIATVLKKCGDSFPVNAPTLQSKFLHGLQDYTAIWQAMREQVDTRDETSADELWLLEHAPVFTQGQAGKAEHVLNPHGIPIVQSDRGGQVTYHGPGQLVAYCLFDLERLGIGTKHLVCGLEKAIMATLEHYGIESQLKTGAPGVYVHDAKIASLGLRVRKGKTYHGLSLNVAMDLTPFSYINPCGFQGMRMVDMQGLGVFANLANVAQALQTRIIDQFQLTVTRE
ncbi:MAG: octanoyltransferase [Gammaproteobacteria bacterium CG11_big_fil_rev_8_21_14_0_20_46_22]|nr:MAG: octanoyltransferase [Gammaproteobacteria bacterium CG12_big_fil_rev_8_21_14_0_65_46_12]PIR11393.1 MAG: octanoyltransferase [Gammaproteobacteria bacterium CG11_big_fil_rev_8_21_14_0_20_46_22]